MTASEIYTLSLIGIVVGSAVVGFLVGHKVGHSTGYAAAVDEWFDGDDEDMDGILDEQEIV